MRYATTKPRLSGTEHLRAQRKVKFFQFTSHQQPRFGGVKPRHPLTQSGGTHWSSGRVSCLIASVGSTIGAGKDGHAMRDQHTRAYHLCTTKRDYLTQVNIYFWNMEYIAKYIKKVRGYEKINSYLELVRV